MSKVATHITSLVGAISAKVVDHVVDTGVQSNEVNSLVRAHAALGKVVDTSQACNQLPATSWQNNQLLPQLKSKKKVQKSTERNKFTKSCENNRKCLLNAIADMHSCTVKKFLVKSH